MVFWRTEYDFRNVEAIEAAGLPCRVECETRRPERWAADGYEHDFWVPQDGRLTIL